MQVLDWESESVLEVLETWSVNGLGPGQLSKPFKCYYLVNISDRFSENQVVNDTIRYLNDHELEVDKGDILMTDFLGHNFLTIKL